MLDFIRQGDYKTENQFSPRPEAIFFRLYSWASTAADLRHWVVWVGLVELLGTLGICTHILFFGSWKCSFFQIQFVWLTPHEIGVCWGPCNQSKEVLRPALLCFTVNQCLHRACWQYGHFGGTQGWLGVGKRVLWLLDTSKSPRHSWRAVVGFTGEWAQSRFPVQK